MADGMTLQTAIREKNRPDRSFPSHVPTATGGTTRLAMLDRMWIARCITSWWRSSSNSTDIILKVESTGKLSARSQSLKREQRMMH